MAKKRTFMAKKQTFVAKKQTFRHTKLGRFFTLLATQTDVPPSNVHASETHFALPLLRC